MSDRPDASYRYPDPEWWNGVEHREMVQRPHLLARLRQADCAPPSVDIVTEQQRREWDSELLHREAAAAIVEASALLEQMRWYLSNRPDLVAAIELLGRRL